MTNQQATYLIACVAGAIVVVAWAALILLPAWSAYARMWERVVAAVLSVYVLAALVLVGVGLGGAFLWYYDRL